MSGRWRSRYWTADDGEAQHHQPDPVNPGGMRADDGQVVRGGRIKVSGHNCDGRGGRSSNEASDGGYNRVNDSGERYGKKYVGVSRQRQFGNHQQQRQHQELHPQRDWRQDERREWERGQSIEDLPDRSCSSSRSVYRQERNLRPSISNAHQNRTTKSGMPEQQTANKPFAWSKPDSSLQAAAAAAAAAAKLPSASKQSVPASADPDIFTAEAISKKPFAWSKPDQTPSTSVSATKSSMSTSMLKSASVLSVEISDSNSSKLIGVAKKRFAWGVKTPDTSCPTETLQTKEDVKPTISKKSLAVNCTFAFPLLSSSTSVSMLSDSASTLNANGEKEKNEVEEFPSLSTASMISHIKQGNNNPPQPMVKAMKFTTDKQRPKNMTSLTKGAPQASLASFLSNQVVTAHRKKSKDARLPVSTSNLVGTKRSTPSSVTMGGREVGIGGMHILAGGTKNDRQRLLATSTPRKKKLTTLKKKVLKERLRVWKERNGIVDCDGFGNCAQGVGSDDEERVTQNNPPCSKRLKTDVSPPIKSRTLLVENYVRPEDNLVDEDEYDEITSDLIQLAGRIGKVFSVFVPRPQDCAIDESTDSDVALVSHDHIGLAFIRFANDYDASAANELLDGMVVGGQKIHTSILNSSDLAQLNTFSKSNLAVAPSDENTRLWRLTVLRVVNERQSSMNVRTDTPRNNTHTANTKVSTLTTIVFHKILCEDDYEDEEALHESIEDLQGLAAEYGQVVGTRWETMGKSRGNVYITYAQRNSADTALKQLNGLIVGGSKIVIGLDVDLPQVHDQSSEVILINILNDDDLEDEDCLSESLNDIRTLAEQYGIIGRVHAEVTGEKKGDVLISYLGGNQIAQQAAQQLDGKVFGGRQLAASISLKEVRITGSLSSKEESKCEPLPIMLSGGKRISEQFAECKRVPKVPNTGTPRAYASKIADERAVPLLVEMLGELMRLQERSKDDKNARARRRLVMGLREVARGIRAHKVKMVIMANNLDEYGALDSKLQEILGMASADEIPILYELNKRKLGKALGKSIKVSVVGIQNADGAHDQFKKLKKMIGMA